MLDLPEWQMKVKKFSKIAKLWNNIVNTVYSLKILINYPEIAKIGFDTADNEPEKEPSNLLFFPSRTEQSTKLT